MSFGFDPEVPGGFQDTDLEQAAFEEESRQSAALRKRGICTHGWQLGRPSNPKFNASLAEINSDRQRGNFPMRITDPSITDQHSIPAGKSLCLDCGQLVDER